MATSKATKGSNNKAKAIAMAKAQVKAHNLEWVVGKGYDLDYAAICDATGLSYAVAWRTVMPALLPKAELLRTTDAKGMPLADERLAFMVADLRQNKQYSWGYIALVMGMGLNAGRVRQLWAMATGLRSQGLRVGAGGRFYGDNADLYTGNDREAKGSELLVGGPVKPSTKRTAGARVAAAKRRAQKA